MRFLKKKKNGNRVLVCADLMHYISCDVIGEHMSQVLNGSPAREIPVLPREDPEGGRDGRYWNHDCDKSLLIGSVKHGFENYLDMRNDPCLEFLKHYGRTYDEAFRKLKLGPLTSSIRSITRSS